MVAAVNHFFYEQVPAAFCTAGHAIGDVATRVAAAVRDAFHSLCDFFTSEGAVRTNAAGQQIILIDGFWHRTNIPFSVSGEALEHARKQVRAWPPHLRRPGDLLTNPPAPRIGINQPIEFISANDVQQDTEPSPNFLSLLGDKRAKSKRRKPKSPSQILHSTPNGPCKIIFSFLTHEDLPTVMKVNSTYFRLAYPGFVALKQQRIKTLQSAEIIIREIAAVLSEPDGPLLKVIQLQRHRMEEQQDSVSFYDFRRLMDTMYDCAGALRWTEALHDLEMQNRKLHALRLDLYSFTLRGCEAGISPERIFAFLQTIPLTIAYQAYNTLAAHLEKPAHQNLPLLKTMRAEIQEKNQCAAKLVVPDTDRDIRSSLARRFERYG